MVIVLGIILGLQISTLMYVMKIYFELKDHRKEMEDENETDLERH